MANYTAGAKLLALNFHGAGASRIASAHPAGDLPGVDRPGPIAESHCRVNESSRAAPEPELRRRPCYEGTVGSAIPPDPGLTPPVYDLSLPCGG